MKGKCLFYQRWINSNILYVKDLVQEEGIIRTDEDLYNIITDKTDILKEISVIKKYIYKRLTHIDITVAPHVKVREKPYIIYKNKINFISDKKSKFFYIVLKSKTESRQNMETIYSRNFRFANNKYTWETIYQQKLADIDIIKVKEFNFKILQNILPCGKVLSKWKTSISSKCSHCSELETVSHMLYECTRTQEIWEQISKCINCNISWKNIVCGWPNYTRSNKIKAYNVIISTVAYAIFKVNSNCKFQGTNYSNVHLTNYICEYLLYCINALSDITRKPLIKMYVKRITDIFEYE